MWLTRKLFPQSVEKLKASVLSAAISHDYAKIWRLVDSFLTTATPEQLVEVYQASLEGPFGTELIENAKGAIRASVKSLGSFAVQSLLIRLEDSNEKWGSPKYEVITLLGEIGDLSAFGPILQIAMKPSLRDAASPALGNLRLADPAGWKRLALACTVEEQDYLLKAGALSQGRSYEDMTGKKWQEEYYLPRETRF